MNKEELKTGIENMDSVDLEIYKVKEVPDEGEKIKFIVKEDVLDLITQLDEPEKLSQEWIRNHARSVSYDGIPDETEIVYVDDLEKLLKERANE